MHKQFKYILMVLMLLLLIGCSNVKDFISKEEAKQIVINNHTEPNGKVSIVSVKFKNNAYYIEWENKINKESGKDRVTKDGEIEMIEASIEVTD